MMNLTWDEFGSHQFETGVDRGVFFPKSGPGVAWNGLVSIKEDVETAGQAVIYVDGQKVVNQLDLGTFSATLDAYTYPDEFEPYDGYSEPMFSGQKRSEFGLSYRTLMGNDNHQEAGYKLHIIYNCLASPSSRNDQSLNSDSEILTFSWDLKTRPEAFPYDRPTSHIIIESPNVEPGALAAVEAVLYGLSAPPRLLTIAELLAIFEANAIITVTSLGGGRWQVTGPDVNVKQLADPTRWQFDWPNVIPLTTHEYRVSSY